MNAYSDFKVRLSGSGEDVQRLKKVMAEALKADIPNEGAEFEIQENYKVVWAWDLAEMARDMANAAREAEFVLEGVSDSTQSSGELMDFRIAYQDGKLTCANSDWYGEWYTSDYGDDYAAYCADYCSFFSAPDDEIEIDLTREKFDALKDRRAYRLNKRVVTHIPLNKPREIPLD